MSRSLLDQPNDRQRALVGPREMKPKGSLEWCWQTLELLKIRWSRMSNDERDFAQTLQELEEAKAWEKIPPQKPYGSLEALLEKEIGKPARDVKQVVSAISQRRQKSAEETTAGDVPSGQGERTDFVDSTKLSQSKRASQNGIGLSTQRKIDWIVLHRPDLHSQIKDGTLSVEAAWIEAGKVVRRVPMPVTVEGAAAAIRRHFTAEEVAEIRSLLE